LIENFALFAKMTAKKKRQTPLFRRGYAAFQDVDNVANQSG
jgi:hypothetical protein